MFNAVVFHWCSTLNSPSFPVLLQFVEVSHTPLLALETLTVLIFESITVILILKEFDFYLNESVRQWLRSVIDERESNIKRITGNIFKYLDILFTERIGLYFTYFAILPFYHTIESEAGQGSIRLDVERKISIWIDRNIGLAILLDGGNNLPAGYRVHRPKLDNAAL